MRIDLILEHWHLFAWGVVTTLELVALSLAVGFCIALPCGLALARGHWLSPLINAYVYVFRGTPLLVQTYLFYYGLGVTLGQYDWVRESILWPVLRDAWWIALFAFSLNSGAYATEIIRGAVATQPKGELEAARALGLSRFQIDRLITIPSALRRALPQYGNEVVFMLHGSVVAGVITIQDIFGTAQTFKARYYVPYEGLLVAAALYMALTFLIVLAFRALERRYLAHLSVSRT